MKYLSYDEYLKIAKKRNAAILKLREKGETYESIGKKFGMTKEGARRIVLKLKKDNTVDKEKK